jgi:glycosyltransferase involved in cell wall biosynthesis
MRVLQVITRVNRGGTAKWIAVLATGLGESGVENCVAAGNVSNDESEDESFDLIHGVKIPHLSNSIHPLNDFKAFIEIRSLIKRYKPDILNTHTSKAGVLGRAAALSLIRNRPVLAHTFHGHLLYGYFNPWTLKTVILIEKTLAKFTQVLIASGEKVRDELLEVGVGELNQYVVVKPGIPSPNFMDRSEARRLIGIDSESVVVGWLGRMVSIKRPERVIEIAVEHKSTIFILAGSGELQDSISRAAPSNAKVIGWSSPEIVWAAADIALLTSDNEAQPISLVEAGYAGLPCVALNVGAVSEVVLDGLSGYLVDRPENLSAAIGRLENSRALRRNLGENARSQMVEQFSVEAFIRTHLFAYETTLRRKKD